MILDNAYDVFTQTLITQGKDALAKNFPRDFEVYMCALELVDQNEMMVDYFMFPVMPRSISKTESETTTVQTSFTGTTIFNKQGFTPNNITIEGDFGRSLKLLPKEDAYYKGVIANSIEEGYYSSDHVNSGIVDKKREFPFGVKSGFGCIKILQSMISKAKSHGPTGVTYKLYFYNMALGESYLVVPTKSPLTFSQTEQSSNMVWQYQLELIIIANLEDVQSRYKTTRSLQNAFSVEQLLGGVASTKTLMKQYTQLLVGI
jgi:hypothetical protein